MSPGARELFSRLRDQRGFALPTTLAVLTGAFGLASAAAVAAMNTHQASKVALAAADAGLQQALADYNLIPTNTTRAVSPSEPAASSRTSRRSQTAGARR